MYRSTLGRVGGKLGGELGRKVERYAGLGYRELQLPAQSGSLSALSC